MRWVKHLAMAHDDPALSAVLEDLGLDSYGLYWMLVELVAAVMEPGKMTPELIHSDVKWSQITHCSARRFRTIARRLAAERLIVCQTIGNRLKITIPNILKYKDEYSKKSGHSPDLSRADTDTEAAAADARAWPQTERTIHELHPGTDERMRDAIVAAAQNEEPDIGDGKLSRLLADTHKKTQRSAALWRETVRDELRWRKKSVLVPLNRGTPFRDNAEEIKSLETWLAEFPTHSAAASSRKRLDELRACAAPDKKPPGQQKHVVLCEAQGAMR